MTINTISWPQKVEKTLSFCLINIFFRTTNELLLMITNDYCHIMWSEPSSQWDGPSTKMVAWRAYLMPFLSSDNVGHRWTINQYIRRSCWPNTPGISVFELQTSEEILHEMPSKYHSLKHAHHPRALATHRISRRHTRGMTSTTERTGWLPLSP